MEDNTVQMQVN
jgi:CTD small phosphatase-like protein 2